MTHRHEGCAVEVAGLHRRWGRGPQARTALEDVTFCVPHGQVVGVLGANGAGKTTLLKILATLLAPSAGHARVSGADVSADPRTVRRRISVVLGGDLGLYPRLTARQNLLFFGMLQAVPRKRLVAAAQDLLDELGLAEHAERRVETFSKGMRQRLHLAIGLLGRPDVMLLDEPTIGLDPEEAARLRRTVRRLAEDGTTVILTSHYLLDIDKMTDRVLLLEHGRITRDMPTADFRGLAGHVGTLTVRGPGRPPTLGAAVPHHTVCSAPDGWQIELLLPSWDPAVLGAVVRAFEPVPTRSWDMRPLSLDDVYSLAGAA